MSTEAAAPEPKVTYLLCSHAGDYDKTLERVKAAAGKVDYIVVAGPARTELGYFSDAQAANLTLAGAQVRNLRWGDDLAEYRNQLLNIARKELKANWVLSLDPDEIPSEAFLHALKGKIIPALEKQGVNCAGAMCYQDFGRPDFSGDLDKMTEEPNDPQETTWRPVLFKLIPEARYTGQGTRSELAPDPAWKMGNLPYAFSYTHRKSALRVMRDTARDLYLSGGGREGVGDLNPMWKELNKIAAELNIGDWPLFEQYVTTFHPNTTHKRGEAFAEGEEQWATFNPLLHWATKALSWRATDYGLDCRSLALWIIFYHRDLLEDPAVEKGVKEPPEPSPDDETERLIRQAYLGVLQRKADPQGLAFYMKAVRSGALPKEMLANEMGKSDEYRAKHPQAPGQEAVVEGEELPVVVPLSATIRLTDEWMMKVLTSSRTWKDKYLPRLEVGRFLDEQLGEEFFKAFYEHKAKGDLTLETFVNSIFAIVGAKAKGENEAQTQVVDDEGEKVVA